MYMDKFSIVTASEMEHAIKLLIRQIFLPARFGASLSLSMILKKKKVWSTDRCVLSSFLVATQRLYMSACPSVRRSEQSVRSLSFFGLLGATYAVYSALFDQREVYIRHGSHECAD